MRSDFNPKRLKEASKVLSGQLEAVEALYAKEKNKRSEKEGIVGKLRRFFASLFRRRR